MNPAETLKRLRNAVFNGNHAEAVAALNDYYQWRVKGGAEPLMGDATARRWANALADNLEETV